MILTTHRVEDFDRWWGIFTSKGAAKRAQHGSKGSRVFRDPNDEARIWVVFDWDEEGFQRFTSDPEVPAIFEEAGIQGPPQAARPAGEHSA
jgi:hypothetical protein